VTEPLPTEAPLYRPNAGSGYPGQQASFAAMTIPTAWDVSTGDAAVYVCVLDNGVDLAHEDITRAANRGINVSTGAPGGNNVATTAAGARGTTVAGAAIAGYANSRGIAGVAGDCSLYSLALPAAFTAATLKEGVDYAVTPPIVLPASTGKVLVLPINALAADAALDASVAAAIAANIVIVMPLGDVDGAPAAALAANSNILLVGAVDNSNFRWTGGGTVGSSYNGLGVVARSVQMPSTDLSAANGINAAAQQFPPFTSFTNNYAITNGTAVAAGIVAGIAALMLSKNPKLNPFDVKRFIEFTAQKTGGYAYGAIDAAHPNGTWNAEVGYGLVDATAALALALKPRIKVIALPSGTTVDFGTVDYTMSVDRVIRFQYVDPAGLATAPIGGSSVTVTLPALPTHITQVGGPASPFTVSPSAPSVDITLRYTAPGVNETIATGYTPTTNDPQKPTLPLNISASSQAPIVFDSVLVIDHSGSMSGGTDLSGQNKAAAAIAAAQLYISLLHNQDNLGIVRFDDLAGDPDDVLLAHRSGGVIDGLMPATSGSATLGARLTQGVNDLQPRGSTSIGGGMELGAFVLSKQAVAPRNARALVVLTDGLQNTGDTPAMAKGMLPAGTRVFAAGLGIDVGTMSQFDDIVTATNGYAFNTGTTAGFMLLQTLFAKIFDDGHVGFAVDPDFVIYPGDAQPTDVVLSEVDVEATFIVIWEPAPEFPKYLRVALETPDGTMLELPAIVAGIPNIIDKQGPSHVVIRCTLPAFPAKPASGNVGRWRLWVGNGTQSRDYEKKLAVSAQGGGVPLHCRTMVMVKSNYRLDGHLVQSSVAPGTPIDVVLEPKIFDLAVKLDSNPDVRVTRPDGTFRGVSMSLAADGSYRGTFTDTGLIGFYTFDASADATSPTGQHMTRTKTFQASIRLPGSVPVGGLGGEVPADPRNNPGGGGYPGGGHGGHGGGYGGGGYGGHGGDCYRCPHCHEPCNPCGPLGRISKALRCLVQELEHGCGHHAGCRPKWWRRF
jgi:hypothetical protein